MKEIFNAAVAAAAFNGKDLMAELALVLETREPRLHAAHQRLIATWPGKQLGEKVFRGIVRWSFLIELAKAPKIDTTKFRVRWAELDTSDPRYASYEECLEMSVVLAQAAAEAVADPSQRALLEAFGRRALLPYELPIDYRIRERSGRLHVPLNAEWLWGDVARKTILLRDYLLGAAVGPRRQAFKAMYKKVAVKTYLTDRVLVGVHKTNREKRWETHPASVHYALRRDCLEIERQLITQLAHFVGFPADLRDHLTTDGLIDQLSQPFRCPITLDPLSFEQFEAEIQNPVAGKSSFQVGHLNPLKAVNDDPRTGHTAKNISWVSADGNRIQGSLSLDETQAMIERIVSNYEALKPE